MDHVNGTKVYYANQVSTSSILPYIFTYYNIYIIIIITSNPLTLYMIYAFT